MPLPAPSSPRVHRHTRNIRAEAFEREDGYWDIDAHITDAKTRVVELATSTLQPNQPIHDLWLRITVDLQLTIHAADAVSDAVPYAGYCDTIGPAYKKLVGLNLLKGFRQGVKERLGGIAGCTHLTELASMLPTAVIQAFAGDVIPTGDTEVLQAGEQQPFQLNRCHALRTDGLAVAKFYPRWVAKVQA